MHNWEGQVYTYAILLLRGKIDNITLSEVNYLINIIINYYAIFIYCFKGVENFMEIVNILYFSML